MTARVPLVLLCAAGALAGCGSAPEVAPGAASCALAADYLATMSPDSGQRVVLSEETETSLSPLPVTGWTLVDGPERGAPPDTLVAKFNRTTLVSAVKYCPAVRAELDKSGIGYGRAAVEKTTGASSGKDVMGVAAPVMANEGASMGALLLLSSRTQGGMNDRVIQYMRRDNSGKWVVAAIHPF